MSPERVLIKHNVIFNNTPGNVEHRNVKPTEARHGRRMWAVPSGMHSAVTEQLIARLPACLRKGRSFSGPVVLQARKGLTSQILHTDFDPNEDYYRAVAENDGIHPAGGVLAIMEGTTIDIGVPCSADGRCGFTIDRQHGSDDLQWFRRRVSIPKGCILLFDGNVVHGGSSYDEDNLRIHVYVELNEVSIPIKRPIDQVYPVNEVCPDGMTAQQGRDLFDSICRNVKRPST